MALLGLFFLAYFSLSVSTIKIDHVLCGNGGSGKIGKFENDLEWEFSRVECYCEGIEDRAARHFCFAACGVWTGYFYLQAMY